MDGALARLYEGWRADLLAARARLEAAIDFPEEDLPADLMLALNLQRILTGYEKRSMAIWMTGRGERLRDGLSIAISARPMPESRAF